LTLALGAGVGLEPWGTTRCFQWINFSDLSACQRFFWRSISQRRFRAADSPRRTDDASRPRVQAPFEAAASFNRRRQRPEIC
jgi:hypothetical protein